MTRITYNIMLVTPVLRLFGVGRNRANGFPARLLVLQRRFLNLVSFWPEIASRKATKLSSAWTDRHEEVLKVHLLVNRRCNTRRVWTKSSCARPNTDGGWSPGVDNRLKLISQEVEFESTLVDLAAR